jgi:phospholipid-binding lipoprotein MlaA
MHKFLIFLRITLIFSFLFPSSAFAKSTSKNTKKATQSAMYYQRFENEDEFETYETNESEIYDPLEKYNRKIYAFNDTFDRYFFEYVAKTYRKSVPKSFRDTIRNFLTNLSLPISTFNSLLQGKTDNSLATFSNFLINSTIGIGGLFDVATKKGIRYNPEDFGQTLGHYGITSGAYLVLPVLGPSSTRDLGGLLVDKSVNPIEFNFLEVGGSENLVDVNYRLAIATASGVDKREGLIDIIDDIRRESFDPYATIRSAYLQKHTSDIKY